MNKLCAAEKSIMITTGALMPQKGVIFEDNYVQKFDCIYHWNSRAENIWPHG